MVPQEGQAWQLPALCICTPHWKQYGASDSIRAGVAAAGRGTPGFASSGTGPASRSELRVVASSTPGSVGCVRSAVVRTPSSSLPRK